MKQNKTFLFTFALTMTLLCRCFIAAVHIQIKGEHEPDTSRLPAWQRIMSPNVGMSPNTSRQVTDMKLKMASWVEKPFLPFLRPNASGKNNALQLAGDYDYSDTDQSGSSTPASNFNSPMPDHRWHLPPTQREIVPYRGQQPKHSNNGFGGIKQGRPTGTGRYAPSPLSGAHKNTTSYGGHSADNAPNSQRGKEIVPFGHDYFDSQLNGEEYHANSVNEHREIVPLEYYGRHWDNNRRDQTGQIVKLVRSLSDVSGRKNAANNRGGLKRSNSDFVLQKCGRMPKLGKMGGKISNLTQKMKMDVLLLKDCIKHSFSGTYMHTNKALKQLFEHKAKIDQPLPPQKGGERSKGGKLLLRDRPEWEEKEKNGTPNRRGGGGTGWSKNPFIGRTPSFSGSKKSG